MSRLFGIGIGGVIGSIIIGFLPTIIAFLKSNDNKVQTGIYQVIVMIPNIVISIFLNILPKFFVFNIIRNVWDVIFIGIWIYMLVCALLDKKMPRP